MSEQQTCKRCQPVHGGFMPIMGIVSSREPDHTILCPVHALAEQMAEALRRSHDHDVLCACDEDITCPAAKVLAKYDAAKAEGG